MLATNGWSSGDARQPVQSAQAIHYITQSLCVPRWQARDSSHSFAQNAISRYVVVAQYKYEPASPIQVSEPTQLVDASLGPYSIKWQERLTNVLRRYYPSTTMKTIDWVLFYGLWVIFILVLPFMYLWAFLRK